MALRAVSLLAAVVCIPARPAACQVTVRDLEIGAHFAFRITEQGPEQERWGVQVLWPFLGRIELNGMVSLRPGFPGVPGLEGKSSQMFVLVGWRPLGRVPRLSIGYGLALSYVEIVAPETASRTSDVTASDAVYVRLSVPLGRLRPFGQLLAANLFGRRDRVQWLAFVGLGVRPF